MSIEYGKNKLFIFLLLLFMKKVPKTNDVPQQSSLHPDETIPTKPIDNPENLRENARTKLFFLLGAQDPEMSSIETILKTQDLPYDFARVGDRRCHPGNAYQADPIKVPDESTLVLVECEPQIKPGDFRPAEIVVIDHHRPEKDLAANMGPEKYWEASSIGQIHELLNLTRTQQANILAAFDHCFPAALRGECPEVNPEEVINLKISEIASGTKRSVEDVREKITFFRHLLKETPRIYIGSQELIDLRKFDLGAGYSFDLLTAQAAVAIEGEAALLLHRDMLNGPEKWSISGNNAPDTVESFMNDWAPSQGLIKIYGVPARGYAWGYKS